MRPLLVIALASLLLAGCGAAPLATSVRGQAPVLRANDDTLRQDVVRGFNQIFKTYDDAPRDGRLSFAEFGRVVTRDWFDAHDGNGDGAIVMDEWLTPAELGYQLKAIARSAAYVVEKADRNADRKLSLDEFVGYAEFEVDPTPWLAEPANPNVKADGFKRYAVAGLLDADRAALLFGNMLARGYYLDDGTDLLR